MYWVALCATNKSLLMGFPTTWESPVGSNHVLLSLPAARTLCDVGCTLFESGMIGCKTQKTVSVQVKVQSDSETNNAVSQKVPVPIKSTKLCFVTRAGFSHWEALMITVWLSTDVPLNRDHMFLCQGKLNNLGLLNLQKLQIFNLRRISLIGFKEARCD